MKDRLKIIHQKKKIIIIIIIRIKITTILIQYINSIFIKLFYNVHHHIPWISIK